MKKILLSILSVALLLTSCTPTDNSSSDISSTPSSDTVNASSELSTANQWEFDSPENHNMDPAVFADLHAALPSVNILSVVTVKDGAIIDEYYREGYDENSIFEMFSASKSYTSALIGIAIDKGFIGGENDLVADYLPQILDQADTRKHSLTIRDLLTHTSGIEWYEWGTGASNWREFRSADNWVDYILNRRIIHQPGTVFNYNTGNTHLLSAILQAATGMTQEEFCRQYLFNPMGVGSETYWRTDPQDIVDGGNGLFTTARDAAKFGQLFLNGGSWDDEQLIPTAWVEQSTSAKNNGAGDGTGSYGYQWWIRNYSVGGYGTYAPPHGEANYDAYYAFGHAGQYIYVVPELNLVTVFTSSTQSSYAPRPYFTDYILAAYMG